MLLFRKKEFQKYMYDGTNLTANDTAVYCYLGECEFEGNLFSSITDINEYRFLLLKQGKMDRPVLQCF